MATSIAELQDIMAQVGATLKEVAVMQKEADRRAAESKAEFDRQTAEYNRMRAETEARWKETDERWKRTDEKWKRTDERYGGLSNSIGEIVEMIIIPGVREKMNEFGRTFTMASPRKEFNKGKSRLTEVDLLLENGEEVMAVEVKTRFEKLWVERHLKRLELLRENQGITGMTGRTMYAAVAGVRFDDDARELAVRNGMYIIEIDQNNERIKIIPPAGEAGRW